MKLQSVRGTRDFFPEDLRLRNWLFGHWRTAATRFGFEEYDAPLLESEELYTRKAGEEITGQLYNFEDKGGRRLALRPEMTPSLVRMLLQKGGALPLPIRWFSIPQCWRYERMTRGRGREHYQWNMDIYGVPGVAAEAELLAAIVHFFKAVGLQAGEIEIRISSRKVLEEVLTTANVPADKFAAVCVLVDKLEKLPREAIEGDLVSLGLEPKLIDTILATLSLKSLDELEQCLGANSEALRDLRDLFQLGDLYGIGDWLVIDPSIVRGLAYYTGLVFEAFDNGSLKRAVCGGGRYDRLLSTYGGKDIPACGFGFGDMVILEVLKDRGLLPTLPGAIDDLVFAFDASLKSAAVDVATRLRDSGRSVDLVLEDKKVKWAFKHADRRGASRVVLVAPDEWASGQVRVKDLSSGEESNIPITSL
jgi:histidyl-tRNA synthetase